MAGESASVPRPAAPVAAAPRGSRLRLQLLGLVVATAMTLGGLLGLSALVSRPIEPRATPTPPTYLLAAPRPAPALRLTGADGQPFDLATQRGSGILVFFGYTHCPDVCPATIGIVGQVLDAVGPDVRAVFVSIDPERDTAEWLADYLRYLPDGFSALTGTLGEVREAADAWGVRYARVDGDDPGEYTMNHTATVYLIDPVGNLRAEFPFGTQAGPMTATVRQVLATPVPGTPATPVAPIPTATAPATAPAPSATPGGSAGPPATPPATPAATATATQVAGPLRVEVVSSSVWARGRSPVILALYDGAGRIDDLRATVDLQLVGLSGAATGPSVRATPVQPRGVADVSYVAPIDVATPGWWKLRVTVTRAGLTVTSTTNVAVIDPGGTAALGTAAPSARTPTLADVGGYAREITTDPAPDLRLYATSTADALAAGSPFVLVIDSTKFRTSPACGQAIVMARFMLDRWPSVPIIHLEPFEYAVISDTPVLQGTLSDPTLVEPAAAWGIGAAPWGPTSMPWIFVVDGSGIVRAKYQGVIGSADVDVLLSLIAEE